MEFQLPPKSTVVVGLSGGVDSAVAALVLKQQGHEVIGLFMKNWDEDDDSGYCSAEEDLKDVRQICKTLAIPLETINFSHEYWKHVFSYFLEEYQSGRTPNPDILCNKEIKFKYFLDHAKKLGADFIATGHYATKMTAELHWGLSKAADLNKDQSYFLHALNQHQLASSCFPLSALQKPEVRRLAREAGFENHAKKDSTGICFIGERKFNTFLQDFLAAQPGNIETPEGNILGKHQGLMFYTLGQRKGIHLGGLKAYQEKPWYVVAKDLNNNSLIVAQDSEHPWQYSTALIANQMNWITPLVASSFKCFAKTRYRQPDQACQVVLTNEDTFVYFDAPQRAVTPGQSLVLYNDTGACLGGGIITGTNSPGGLLPKHSFYNAFTPIEEFCHAI